MKPLAFVIAMLLSGCAPLMIEQRAATLDAEVRSIQTDFKTLAATMSPEQEAKYERAKAVQDDATFQEFLASLDTKQQTAMHGLLARSTRVEQERQRLTQVVQQDLALRHMLPRIGPVGTPTAGGI